MMRPNLAPPSHIYVTFITPMLCYHIVLFYCSSLHVLLSLPVLVDPTTVELTLSPTDAPTLQPTTQAPTTQAPTDTSCVEGRGSCTRDNDCCSDSCLRSQGKCQVVREDCEDSVTWRAVFNGELGCVWVTLDPSARCNILGEGGVIAFEECLVACEKC